MTTLPLSFVRMSATLAERVPDVFALLDVEHREPLLARRLGARKRPKSCSLYNAAPTRKLLKVSGRKRMSWQNEDWLDAAAAAHRGPDD